MALNKDCRNIDLASKLGGGESKNTGKLVGEMAFGLKRGHVATSESSRLLVNIIYLSLFLYISIEMFFNTANHSVCPYGHNVMIGRLTELKECVKYIFFACK